MKDLDNPYLAPPLRYLFGSAIIFDRIEFSSRSFKATHLLRVVCRTSS